VPFVGIFVDKVGQTCVMIGAAILFMVTAYPAFVLLGAAPSLGVLIAMVCWISLLKSFFSGALPSLMAKTYFGADLRRVCAIFRPIADRSHRQQIGAELLHDRDCSFKPGGVAGDALEISVVGKPADGKRQTTNWEGIVAVVCRLICVIRRRLQRQPFIGNSSLPVAKFSGQTETYCLPFS
jgi:hypothetical protein